MHGLADNLQTAEGERQIAQTARDFGSWANLVVHLQHITPKHSQTHTRARTHGQDVREYMCVRACVCARGVLDEAVDIGVCEFSEHTRMTSSVALMKSTP